jgi:hypothetical protein
MFKRKDMKFSRLYCHCVELFIVYDALFILIQMSINNHYQNIFRMHDDIEVFIVLKNYIYLFFSSY